jgi:hypothetical protein
MKSCHYCGREFTHPKQYVVEAAREGGDLVALYRRCRDHIECAKRARRQTHVSCEEPEGAPV